MSQTINMELSANFCIYLIADIAFVRAQPAVFVQPHVVVEVVLRDEHLLADFARVALLTLVHHPKNDLFILAEIIY